MHIKDAIDLLQGHYIVSVSRDMTPRPPQTGGLESIAVSTSQLEFFCEKYILCFSDFQYH